MRKKKKKAAASWHMEKTDFVFLLNACFKFKAQEKSSSVQNVNFWLFIPWSLVLKIVITVLKYYTLLEGQEWWKK